MLRFINLEFDYRDKLGLTTSEFILLSVVNYRQNAPGKNGWCHDGAKELLRYTDTHLRYTQMMIKSLVEKNFLERSENGKLIRVTQKWTEFLYEYEPESTRLKQSHEEEGTRLKQSHDATKIVASIAPTLLYGNNNKEGRTPEALLFPFDSEKFKEAWDHWIKDRKERGKKVTHRAAQMQLKKLAELTQSDSEAICIIFQSIESNWQTFYPLKKDNAKNNQSNDLRVKAEAMANRHKEYHERFGK
jgi:DNA-binding MarR family transcriptional regulator